MIISLPGSFSSPLAAQHPKASRCPRLRATASTRTGELARDLRLPRRTIRQGSEETSRPHRHHPRTARELLRRRTRV